MPQILEQELEEYIFNNANELFKSEEISPNEKGELGERIVIPKKVLRQVQLGEYGRIDLLVVKEDEIIVVELKQKEIDFNAVGQVCRYITGLKRLIKPSVTIKGLLIGEDLANGDVCYALNDMYNIELWTYALDLATGIKFDKEHSGWHLTEEGFDQDRCKELATSLKEFAKEITATDTDIDIPF